MKNSLFATMLIGATLAVPGHSAVTITIQVLDGAGVGFNDTTVTAPVGGNSGTTLGAQRLIAFQAAANIWGATLTSPVPIVIGASWTALQCTATSAILGSAGATWVERDVPGVAKTGTWYPVALANKYEGTDLAATLDPTYHIAAQFNINLGNADCLTGTPFYLGLDGNHGSAIDLVTVLLHEFGHGLGFQTFTNRQTGALKSGYPSIWDWYLMDNLTGKIWAQMTDTERAASAITGPRLVWSGPLVTANTSTALTVKPYPRAHVNAPATLAADYLVGQAAFGPALSSPGVTGEVWPVVDPGTGSACAALTGANLNVAGKIALVDRGTCAFTIKVKNCQNAGAIGVLVANNAAGSPPPAMSGTDASITIPAVLLTQADGAALRTFTNMRSRSHTGLYVNLGLDVTRFAGTDSAGRMLMYAPSPFQPGSSVSHWDTTATPNQLMEPGINTDLTHQVTLPKDLTLTLLQEIGW
jgi:hypothetical protein